MPTGTVTLLLADVEGSTRLGQNQPDEMTAVIAHLDQVVSDVIAAHDGVRLVEPGGGDSVVVAFERASDALACALALQRAPLAPMRLRIGIHTGQVQLPDADNYLGPTINRTARLRDLAHGGQTVMSGTTSDLVAKRLPPDAWLTDLGTHRLPGGERVMQLCHPDLPIEFSPLRIRKTGATAHLPVQLSSFVGRDAQLTQLRAMLAEHRLITLTGAGGVGKTRLAIQLAAQLADEFADGVWYVDLAPITDADLVPVTVARALGLLDDPGRSTIDTLTRFVAERQMLVVLDNCEHLLDASAALIVTLVGAAAGLTLLATSREPIGVAGEVNWRVPSLSLADEAIQLFTDRARLARPDFALRGDDVAAVREICARLDGMPLAIELAAARVRTLAVAEILEGLHDRFRLLTGGARTAVRRQQTLRASVDWSHALLTQPERVLFRRLAVFVGGFDLDAAHAVAGGGDVQRYQVLDQLIGLVDKSLAVTEHTGGATRYRLLETLRQYALEKLDESGEADTMRGRHRDHYTALAALLDSGGPDGPGWRVQDAETEIDNLRAAFAWSRGNGDIELALQLASSLQPLWVSRARVPDGVYAAKVDGLREGRAWFNAILGEQNTRDPNVAPAVRARALADKARLEAATGDHDSVEHAEQTLAVARELDDSAVLVRALLACAASTGYDPEKARPYFAEALDLARALGDRWMLSEIHRWQAYGAAMVGDPIAARAAAEQGRDVADAIGDRVNSGRCRVWLGWAQVMHGDLAGAATQFGQVRTEAAQVHDAALVFQAVMGLGHVLAYQGDTSAARAAAETCIAAAPELGGIAKGAANSVLAIAAIAAGDVLTARQASEEIAQHAITHVQGEINVVPMAQVTLASGDLIMARRWAEEAVSTTRGWYQMLALSARARVTSALADRAQAERDLHDALARGAAIQARVGVADILECLADLRGDAGSHREAARLMGAAQAIRQRVGEVRFELHQTGYETSVTALCQAMGKQTFDSAWEEGAALSIDEAIAYAQRGRGQRKRPTSGWESLTPTERDVVRLVSEGLTNNDIATRLFVSPRTVQTHLSHVYTKLGLTSRVQLVQEAARYT